MTEPEPTYTTGGERPDEDTIAYLQQRLIGLRSDALSIAAESERILETLGRAEHKRRQHLTRDRR